jgi:arginyl-tRNA synthetase
MMNAQQIIADSFSEAFLQQYNIALTEKIPVQKTRKEFEGDFTIVTFPFTKITGEKKPEQIGNMLGDAMLAREPLVASYNVVKGFLNISLSQKFWLHYFNSIISEKYIGYKTPLSSGKTVMVEYSSPNTNKPLHLGHIRNNILGFSIAQLLKANGHQVIMANLINDRGIHICKSMLAWQKFGHGETPESSGLKGDHLVGKYYVIFDKEYKKEIELLITKGQTKEEAEKNAPLIVECQNMLLQWEGGNQEVINLWKTMNRWVYKGFEETYSGLGVGFDKMYYESNTYLLGKEIVAEGLKKNIFYKKENGSVAIDLTANGLDEKIVLRSDGTSVYITQDLGTAIERFKEFPQLRQLIYTVGNEQDYHFKVLFKILEKLGYDWAKECYHLSYGMVELPEGKMKSREGTVVDADELIAEMISTAKSTTQELGKTEGFSENELENLYKSIGLGALKYFILKVDPKKKMLFDPKESIDFNGHTGPFIQYTHARIMSVLNKANINFADEIKIDFNPLEKELIKLIYDFEATLEEAAQLYNPSIIANYVYELVKIYNRFYHEHTILKEENEDLKKFRLQLSKICAQVIKNGMNILGIEVPHKM